MNVIDIEIVLIGFLISNGVYSLFVSLFWLREHKRFAGLGLWFVGFVMQFVAFPLLALRDVVPDLLSTTVGNTLVISGVILLYMGLEQFVGKSGRQTQNAILLGIFIFLHAYFTLINPNFGARAIVFSTAALLLFFQCARLMLSKVDPDLRSSTRPLGFIFIAFSLVSFIRLLEYSFLYPGQRVFLLNPMEIILDIAYSLLLSTLAVGLYFMVNQRLFVTLGQEAATHKRTAELLRQSEEKYYALFQNSSDAILLTAPDGSVYSANPAACAMLGRTEAEICSLGRAGLIDISDPRLPILLEERARTGVGFGELRMLRSDGAPFPVELSSTIFHDHEGNMRTSMIIREITERKKTEMALRESEKKYRSLAEFTPNGLLIHLHGKIVFSNTAAANQLGPTTPEEMVGRQLMNFVHPDYRGIVIDRVRQLTENKNSVPVIEEKLVRLDGTVIDAEVAAIPFVFNGENAVQVVFRDITKRKQAEAALQRSEERFSTMVNGTVEGILVHRNTKPLFVNPAYARILGYESPDEILSMDSVIPLIAPYDQARLLDIHATRIKGEAAPPQYEYDAMRKDGSVITLQQLVSTIFWDNQPAVLASIIDVTERKRLVQELQNSEHRLRTIFENAPIAITIGRDGRLLYANPMYARIHDFANANDLIGQPIMERVAPQSRAGTQERSQLLSKGLLVDAQYEFLGLHRDGSEFPIIAHVRQVNMEDGPANIGFFQDITELKQIEKREQEQHTLAEVLRDTAEALNNSLNLDDVLEKILDLVERVIHYDAVTITWVEEDHIRAVRSRGYTPEQEKFINEQKTPLDNLSIFTEAIEKRQPIIVPDTSLYTYREASPYIAWIRSKIKVPIIVDERVVGLINLSSKIPNYFNTDHARILQIFANQVATAVRNAALYEKVQRLAIVDELTGIYNRRGFFEVSRREVGRLQRFGRSFSVLFVDIDHFKQFNDRYSYETGDRVLRLVAETLQSNSREIDCVGRYGGEEMVILLPEIQYDAAIEIAERLRRVVETLRVDSEQGQLQVTISIGSATLTPIRGQTLATHAERQEKILNDLLAKAGEALHIAKQQGRNKVVAYNEKSK